MTTTFKVLSALLGYPTDELKAASPELEAAIDAEALLPASARDAVVALIDDIRAGDIYDMQERYVLLFDRTRSLSLHLFEHIHGEGRDRGQAMVDLMALYDEHGLEISARELPDYLPLFLEFLSTRPFAEARELLSQPLDVIAALGERLRRRDSVYAGVFDALGALAAAEPNQDDLRALLDEPDDDPNDLAALDALWEEEAVTFGPGSALDQGGDCPQTADMLRRMGADQPSGTN
jgi:nitrate reductase delta subunit